MSDTPKLAIQQHVAAGLPEHKAGLLAIFTEVYAERLDNPFLRQNAFGSGLRATPAKLASAW